MTDRIDEITGIETIEESADPPPVEEIVPPIAPQPVVVETPATYNMGETLGCINTRLENLEGKLETWRNDFRSMMEAQAAETALAILSIRSPSKKRDSEPESPKEEEQSPEELTEEPKPEERPAVAREEKRKKKARLI